MQIEDVSGTVQEINYFEKKVYSFIKEHGEALTSNVPPRMIRGQFLGCGSKFEEHGVGGGFQEVHNMVSKEKKEICKGERA